MSPAVPYAQNARPVMAGGRSPMTEPPGQAPSHDGAEGRTPSERDWLRANSYLHANRHGLAVRAATAYPQAARLADTPLLAAPAWRLPAPVPLDRIRLEFRPSAPPPDLPS